jgi:acyl carrier protein
VLTRPSQDEAKHSPAQGDRSSLIATATAAARTASAESTIADSRWRRISDRDATLLDLIALCKDVLKVSSVEANQTFLECGGDSIRATQFIWSIEKKYGVRLEIDDVLDNSLIQLLVLLSKSSRPAATENPETLATLCEICRQTLKVKAVEYNQSFLECGGDSIRAVQFIGQMEKQFNTALDLDDVLSMSMLQLASKIDSNTAREASGASVAR